MWIALVMLSAATMGVPTCVREQVLNLGYLDPNKTHVARPMEIRTGQQIANSQTITTQGRQTTTATDNSKTTNQTTATTERAIARKENTTAIRV